MGTITSYLKRTVVSGTTSAAGILLTDIPFDSVISVSIATTGQNIYCLARKAGTGYAAIFVFDNTFTAFANESVSVTVAHL